MPRPNNLRNAVARRLEPVTERGPQAAGATLRRIAELAIEGRGRFPGARTAAAKQLQRHIDAPEAAVEALITSHVRLGTGQGFVTNVGGLAVLPIAIPANLTGIAVVQVRMVAAIAHLRGYDLDDSRVRTAIMMCLLGGEQIERRIADNKLPSRPLAVATAPVFDPKLQAQVSEAVISNLLARVGGKQLPLLVARRIPLVGGGVGAVVDGMTTYQLGKFASGELVRRRAIQP
jgi:uncharacterized protein (DUF697 family)